MARQPEAKLLRPCRQWLDGFLNRRFRNATITVLKGTERRRLGASLGAADLGQGFPEASAWEVMVDVAAVVQRRQSASLVFVELKASPIKLRDVGQLLGYCRVCRPIEAFLLSPEGPSADLDRLLTTYGRTDVLRYEGRYIHVGRWLSTRAEPDLTEMIPGGVLASFGPAHRRSTGAPPLKGGD